MKYLLLAYGNEPQWAALPAPTRQAFAQASQAQTTALHEDGYLVEARALQNSRTATTLWVQDGELCLNAGPATESETQLRELFLINARDLNEAIQVAARLPHARQGPIEIRPLAEMDATLG
jgi:hypothetical protein